MSGVTIEVAIALVWRDATLLITRRPTGLHLGGLWEFPGGKLRSGESPETAAVREVLEEVGVTCSAAQRRTRIEYSYPERSVVLHPVDCRWLHGEPQRRQVMDFHWATPAELAGFAFPAANTPLIDELTKAFRPR